MDQQRFDRLTRAMARGVSRRSMLAGAAVAAAGLLGRRVAEATTAPDWRMGFPGSFCGGIAGIGCPAGYQCVIDTTVCDPANGGADCGGRCEPATADNPCAAMLCQEGTECCPNCGGVCVSGGATCSDELCGDACGRNRCKRGEVCCNESCGICTPPGGMCPMIACLPDEQPMF